VLNGFRARISRSMPTHALETMTRERSDRYKLEAPPCIRSSSRGRAGLARRPHFLCAMERKAPTAVIIALMRDGFTRELSAGGRVLVRQDDRDPGFSTSRSTTIYFGRTGRGSALQLATMAEIQFARGRTRSACCFAALAVRSSYASWK